MKKKNRLRPNAVDIAVIILLISAAVITVFRYKPDIGDAAPRYDIVYYLKIDSLSSDFKSNITVGDRVMNFDDGALLGTVYEISSSSPEGRNATETVYITVKTTAEEAGTGYLVNGINIHAGNTMQLRFPNLYCTAECIGVKIADS